MKKIKSTGMGFRLCMLTALVALLTLAGCKSKKKEAAPMLTVKITEVQAKQEGELISIPISSNTQLVQPTASHNWIQAMLNEDSTAVTVMAEMNITGETRTGNVTISTDGPKEKQLTQNIKVTQNSLDVYQAFKFAQDEYVLNFTEGSSQISLVSMGKWVLSEETELPGWIELSPKSGKGDSYINLKYKSNVSTSERAVQIMFTNKELGVTTLLKLRQEGNSAGIYDFSHLGKGYDSSGEYANDDYVRASVLDCEEMYNQGHIADAINNNSTTEETVSGRTRDEYMRSLATHAKANTGVGHFKGSMEANFEKSALTISENSYYTHKTFCKKQIIKIHENVTPAMLKNCVSEGFKEDVKRLKAADLVAKYGTSVITGLSLGGELSYNMATNRTFWSSSKDVYAAVQAGYKSEAFSVGGEASVNVKAKDLKDEGYLSDKFYCRGGESQYASGGIKRTYESYEKWLDSLKERNLWVMVDHEGNCLVPLYEFIFDNSAKKDELEKYIKDYLSQPMVPQKSQMKRINVELERISFFPMIKISINVVMDKKDKRPLIKDEVIGAIYTPTFAAIGKAINKKLRMPYEMNCNKEHFLDIHLPIGQTMSFKYLPAIDKWEFQYNKKLYSTGEKMNLDIYHDPDFPEKGKWGFIQIRILEE